MDYEPTTSTNVWPHYEFLFEKVTNNPEALRLITFQVEDDGSRQIDDIREFDIAALTRVSRRVIEEYYARGWSKTTFKFFTPDGFRLVNMFDSEQKKIEKIFRDIAKEYVK